MFKKPSRKQYIIRRVLLATVATVSVIVIVAVSILFMLGYRLDSGNGRLEQGALLQFDSRPNGAFVTVDGALVNGKTATKLSTLAGSHTVTMTRDGYQPWTRTLTVEAGTLTWLDYTILVPAVRTVEPVISYDSLDGFNFAPDLKWAVALPKQDSPALQLVDLRAEAVKTASLTIPEGVYTDATTAGVTHTFGLRGWNEEGRYLLMQHTYNTPAAPGHDAASHAEWLVVDTQDIAKTVNVTRLLSVNFSSLQFAGTSGTTLFGLSTDGVVRKLDLSAGTISRSLITNVSNFSVFNGTVLAYEGVDPANVAVKVVGVYRDGDEAAHVIRSEADASKVLKIAVGRYYGDDYMAIATGASVEVLSGTYPSSASTDTSSLKSYGTFSAGTPVTSLSFSEKGDYVLAQSGTQFTSYEIEHHRAAVASVASQTNAVPALHWLDSAHVWNDTDGSLVMRDFNGLNANTIMTVAPGYDATLSQNGRYMYGIGKTATGYQLQRVKMILD